MELRRCVSELRTFFLKHENPSTSISIIAEDASMFLFKRIGSIGDPGYVPYELS
jgi:hypothetical protein